MSAATVLDKQINNYLVQLNTKQKKAVLTVVKTFVEYQDQEDSPWKDPAFVGELDRRVVEFRGGKIKGYTWEEVKQKARQSLKSRKKK